MDKKIQSYETIFVVDTTNGDENVKAVIEKFTNLIAANGEITQVNDWGKRRLAYPINYRTEGYYTLIYFNAPTEFAAELKRFYNINENILRSIVVREDEKVKHAAADAPETVVPGEDDDEPVKAEEIAEEAAEAEETVEEAAEAAEEAVEEVVEEAAAEVEETAEAVEEAAEEVAEAAEEKIEAAEEASDAE